ncbi:Chitin elicitor receptor kinase 1 [Madurella mycetomatis]|uniref:Chitin elicitor receptor kinase 1 n=1 Tax=Madurella mycetomatis TaxID=100816 RepID=A0A175VWH0_9PEZI|nr:Chitin elicitor receptor kinase 1 [Madurella mycetomatis]
MADDVTRDLVVALQSISYSGSSSATLLSSPVNIFIDSTDPNIWLPADACDAFERAFGLTLDDETGLYLVNETHRNTLLDSNSEVSFRLSDVRSGGDTVTIVLPFAAFDLTAEHPLVGNTSHYFPLKRANSSTQYTLGRTFLQEAYLSVDYERRVFNVSACLWNQGAQENIVTITSVDSDSTSTGDGPSSSDSSGLSSGAIAGIAVSCVVVAIAAVALIILLRRRKKIRAVFAVEARVPEPDESVLKGPVFNSPSRYGSTPDDSVPFSADDVSASRSRSTAEYSRPGSGTIGESAIGGSTAELDGRDTLVRPDTELDGDEIQRPLPRIAESPSGVYELPGSSVAVNAGSKKRESAQDRAPSTEGSLWSRNEKDGGNDSPPSPLVSTLGTNWEPGRQSIVGPEPVSPNTPASRHGARPF